MRTHLQSNTRLYRTWAGIKKRCQNKNATNYYLYGGRGINICEEWNVFENFMEWANATNYNDNLIIDRENYNGNYEPSNCRWVNEIQSANNKRTNLYFQHNGKKQTLSEILAQENLSSKYSVIHNRIMKLGWTLDEALVNVKYSKYKKGTIGKNSIIVVYEGIEYNLSELLRKLNIFDKYYTVKARLVKLNWSLEKAILFKQK